MLGVGNFGNCLKDAMVQHAGSAVELLPIMVCKDFLAKARIGLLTQKRWM